MYFPLDIWNIIFYFLKPKDLLKLVSISKLFHKTIIDIISLKSYENFHDLKEDFLSFYSLKYKIKNKNPTIFQIPLSPKGIDNLYCYPKKKEWILQTIEYETYHDFGFIKNDKIIYSRPSSCEPKRMFLLKVSAQKMIELQICGVIEEKYEFYIIPLNSNGKPIKIIQPIICQDYTHFKYCDDWFIIKYHNNNKIFWTNLKGALKNEWMSCEYNIYFQDIQIVYSENDKDIWIGYSNVAILLSNNKQVIVETTEGNRMIKRIDKIFGRIMLFFYSYGHYEIREVGGIMIDIYYGFKDRRNEHNSINHYIAKNGIWIFINNLSLFIPKLIWSEKETNRQPYYFEKYPNYRPYNTYMKSDFYNEFQSIDLERGIAISHEGNIMDLNNKENIGNILTILNDNIKEPLYKYFSINKTDINLKGFIVLGWSSIYCIEY